jgi:transposase
MPTSKPQEVETRRIAFEALHARNLSRLAIQARLGISRSEFYRLRAALLTAKREPSRAK